MYVELTGYFCQGAVIDSFDADVLEEIWVCERPSSERRDNQPQNPKKEIEEEEQVFGACVVAHLGSYR